MIKITFRPSQPQDVEQAIPLIYSSGPAAFNYVFSDQYPEEAVAFLKSAFVWGDSEFGYRQQTVAVLDGQVVGIGGIRFANQNLRFMVAAVRSFFRFYSPVAAVRTIRRGLKIEQILHPPKRNVGIIYQLGVAPPYQSQGIGSQLIGHLLGEIRARGMKAAALDVAVANSRAQKLYEREGFMAKQINKGQLSSKFGHVDDHVYMERALS